MGLHIIIKKDLSNDMMVLKLNDDYVIALKNHNRVMIKKAIDIIVMEGYLMKNRVLLLCLKHHIETVTDYAELMHIDYDYAELVLKEKAPMTNELIIKNCEYFGVSKEYLLCQI